MNRLCKLLIFVVCVCVCVLGGGVVKKNKNK